MPDPVDSKLAAVPPKRGKVNEAVENESVNLTRIRVQYLCPIIILLIYIRLLYYIRQFQFLTLDQSVVSVPNSQPLDSFAFLTRIKV